MSLSRRLPLYYKSKEIKDLPRTFKPQNETNGSSLLLDYLGEAEISPAFAFTQQAAVDGMNVGIDEYRNLSEFNELLSDAEAFTVKDGIGKIQALIIIHPCWFSRSASTCLASLVVIPSKALYVADEYRALVRLACELTVALDLRYELCVIDVFVCYLDMTLQLRQEGFRPQFMVPSAGTVAGHGEQYSYMMVKDLQVTPQPHRSLEEVCDLYEQYNKPGNDALTSTVNELPKMPFLPLFVTFSNSIQAKVRSIKTEQDLRILYGLFDQSIKAGKGYGTDELPSFAFFSRVYCKGQYVALFEDIKTGRVMGGVLIQTHGALRTRAGKIADTALVTDTDFQGKNMGVEMLYMVLVVIKKLGYKGNMSDSIMTNIPMLKLGKKMNYQPIGIFPRTTYLSKHGWMDSVVSYFDINQLPENYNNIVVSQ